MKIHLEKQKIKKLSPSECDKIKGGGCKRSNRLNGGCRYSDKHPTINDCGNVTGCAC